MEHQAELPENSVDAFLDDGLKQQEAFSQAVEKNQILIHKVFVQNEDGVELLKKFTEDLVMIPSVTPMATQFEAGMNEGYKEFVRHLIRQIAIVEAHSEETQ